MCLRAVIFCDYQVGVGQMSNIRRLADLGGSGGGGGGGGGHGGGGGGIPRGLLCSPVKLISF